MTLASRWKRFADTSACRALLPAACMRINLIAAERASIWWLAFHTSPMPPSPIGATSR